jgi:hypothetical protein
MTRTRGIVALVAVAAALPALGSAPCNLFQVRMGPATGATNVSAPVTLMLESVSFSEADLVVEDEAGRPVDVPHEVVDAGASRVMVRITDFPGPGWYGVRVAVSHANHESSDRSMLPTHVGAWGGRDEFRGEVLVGRSEPGVRTLSAYRQGQVALITLTYSELVQFPDASIPNVEFRDSQGFPLPCSEQVWLSPDGGLRDFASYTCDGGFGSLVVTTPPWGVTGTAATLPEPGSPWTLPPSPGTYLSVLTDVRAKSLDDHTPSGLGATYEKCDVKYPRCGCDESGGAVVLALAAWLLAWRRR